MSDRPVFDLAASRAYLRSYQEREFRLREQRRQEALQSVRAAAQSVLPRFPGVRRAYLFGSVLRPGAMNTMSDVDLALEGDLDAEALLSGASWKGRLRVGRSR